MMALVDVSAVTVSVPPPAEVPLIEAARAAIDELWEATTRLYVVYGEISQAERRYERIAELQAAIARREASQGGPYTDQEVDGLMAKVRGDGS